MKGKCVLFGSGSFIGKHLAQELRNQGHMVIAYGSNELSYVNYETGFLGENIEIPSDADCVYYLSQSPYYRNPGNRLSHLIQVNTVNPIVLAERAKSIGIKRFIYFSSGSVYQPSYQLLREDSETRRDEWYLFSKLAAEEGLKILESASFTLHFVRPFSVYGPGQKNMLISNLINSVKEGREIFLEPGETGNGIRLSLTYIHDILNPLIKLGLEGGPRLMNLSSNHAANLAQVVTFISKELRQPINVKIRTNPRQGDFVADSSQLSAWFPTKFTSWEEGLKAVLSDLS